MAIFKKNKATLHTQIANKASELRDTQKSQADSADYYLAAASTASANSTVASKHAEAVETALTILEKAGVPL